MSISLMPTSQFKIQGARCGQAAVEMLSYAAFFLFVFVSSASILLHMQNQEILRAETAYAQNVAHAFSNNIHVAFISGEGYKETVKLPKDILGKRYWLLISRSPNANEIETGFVYVEWLSDGKNMSFSAPTITANYTWVTDADKFISHKAEGGVEFIVIDAKQGHPVSITNKGGGILIEKG